MHTDTQCTCKVNQDTWRDMTTDSTQLHAVLLSTSYSSSDSSDESDVDICIRNGGGEDHPEGCLTRLSGQW